MLGMHNNIWFCEERSVVKNKFICTVISITFDAINSVWQFKIFL